MTALIHRYRAFTLIEIIVAMSITVLIVATLVIFIYQFMYGLGKVREAQGVKNERIGFESTILYDFQKSEIMHLRSGKLFLKKYNERMVCYDFKTDYIIRMEYNNSDTFKIRSVEVRYENAVFAEHMGTINIFSDELNLVLKGNNSLASTIAAIKL